MAKLLIEIESKNISESLAALAQISSDLFKSCLFNEIKTLSISNEQNQESNDKGKKKQKKIICTTNQKCEICHSREVTKMVYLNSDQSPIKIGAVYSVCDKCVKGKKI